MARINLSYFTLPTIVDDFAMLDALSAMAFMQQAFHTLAPQQQQPQQQQQGATFNFFYMPAAPTAQFTAYAMPHAQQQQQQQPAAAGFNFQDFLNQTFQAAQQQKAGPPPTKKDALESLPVFKFTEKREQQLKKQEAAANGDNCCTCAVCQCDFERDELLVKLPCQHIYHKDCIQPWLKEHNTCACCRFELPVDDAKEEVERRKRMAQRYTEHGLKIIEVASAVESICCKTEAVVEEIASITSSACAALGEEQQQRRLKHLELELNKFDATLMQNMLLLDSMDNLTEGKHKEQKKQQIIKIQEILNTLDQARKTITESKSQQQQSNPATTEQQAPSSSNVVSDDKMELC